MQNDGSISPLRQFLRLKWVRVVLVLNVVTVIVIIGILIFNATRVSNIVFNITPVDSTITVNGRSNYQNGTYAFTPGKYDITISHEGMETKTLTIELDPHYVATIAVFLVDPEHTFTFYELKEHQDSMQILQSIASFEHNTTTDHDSSAEAYIASFLEKYQLINLLPIAEKIPTGKGLMYGTHYMYDTLTIQSSGKSEKCTTVLCLYITGMGSNTLEHAFNIIKEYGYNPESYQIVYEEVEHE